MQGKAADHEIKWSAVFFVQSYSDTYSDLQYVVRFSIDPAIHTAACNIRYLQTDRRLWGYVDYIRLIVFGSL